MYSRKVWWGGFGEFTLFEYLAKKAWQIRYQPKKVIYCNWMVLVWQTTDDLPNFPAIWYVCVKVWLYWNFIADHWKIMLLVQF